MRGSKKVRKKFASNPARNAHRGKRERVWKTSQEIKKAIMEEKEKFCEGEEEEDHGVYVTKQGELVPINVQERRAEARRHAGKSIWGGGMKP